MLADVVSGPLYKLLQRAEAAQREWEKLAKLTPREYDMLRGLAQHKRNKEIGHELKLSEHTVERHVTRILAKLGVSSRYAAAQWARDAGLLERARRSR